ncbi:MOSC N-terminal beta barrel domain-containing protein [Coleofasciculus sp. F4-SAH-05]
MTSIIQLSGIYIYPIKSAGGIALSTAQVSDRGLQYKRWCRLPRDLSEG